MKVLYKNKYYKKDVKSRAGFLFDHKKGDLEETIFHDAEFCCDEMEEAFEEKVVHFGEYENFRNKNCNINISHCSPYPEGAVFDDYTIKYCPFCSKVISLKEIR